MEDIQKLRFSLELGKERKYQTGVQAMVFATIVQSAQDRARGWNTAGIVSGYRGSPLGGLDRAFLAAEKVGALKKANVTFHAGINEDLAADIIWGSQQVNLIPGSRVDGVFGMWYGKGPGLDRSVDAIKHANYAGTAPKGGVIAMIGDDHACKSSTMPYQSDQACIHIGMPILAPGSVQEVLDYCLHGWAMSRYSATWTSIKAITDVCEASSTVIVDPHKYSVLPKYDELHEERRHIRINIKPLELEGNKHERLGRAVAFADANGINAITNNGDDIRFGIVAVGHAYVQTMEALRMLELTERDLKALGIAIYRVGMPWPFTLSNQGIRRLVAKAQFVLVIEEREGIVESQLKAALHGHLYQPAIVGKEDRRGYPLLPEIGTLNAAKIASAIADVYCAGWSHPALECRAEKIALMERTAHEPPAIKAERVPYYCSGCPHNTSTRIPEGTIALAGIGCHYMAQWMPDRPTILVTQMGGEGVPALGFLPFSDMQHVFANMGDGTYFHSGVLAIRAAVAWSEKFLDKGITYKILYNDAVAMTGGQHIDGPFSVPQITHQVYAEGVRRIEVVAELPDAYSKWDCAPGTRIHPRSALAEVMDDFTKSTGISVLVYDQTCAVEKRRRRKRGLLPDPSERVFINERVCEGCGDCSRVSNCLSIEPVETVFGTKRRINQSSCNKDYSCVQGFCPSFVLVDGAEPAARKSLAAELADTAIPEPPIRTIFEPYNILLMGTGGTGVITVEQILATAAHRAGLSASGLSITGLSQKYGAVSSHVRIGPADTKIFSPRISWGEADLLLGCDLVSSSGRESLSMLGQGRTSAVVNVDVAPTAEFVHDRNATLPKADMLELISTAVGLDKMHCIEATSYARELFGDSIETNIFLIGYAFQLGLIPIASKSIHEAIELNGQDVAGNLRTFACGRFAAAFPQEFASKKWQWKRDVENARPTSHQERFDRFCNELIVYQDKRYAFRYRHLVERVAVLERNKRGMQAAPLTEAVVDNYFKLLAYKDEYEVARLYSNGEFKKQLDRAFGKRGKRMSLMLAPPLFSRKDPKTGLPQKGRYGRWIFTAMRFLAKGKFLRGTRFDPFGYTRDRKDEKELILWYEHIVEQIEKDLNGGNYALALELLKLPDSIRGFGHVKRASMVKAQAKAKSILARFSARAGMEPLDGS